MSIRCEHCSGSGLADKPGPGDDELLDRAVLYAIEIARLRELLKPFSQLETLIADSDDTPDAADFFRFDGVSYSYGDVRRVAAEFRDEQTAKMEGK